MNKGERTKTHILSKSAELFNLRGYDGCSLHDIMTATGLKKGGIYNHFDNKEDIALQAFEYSLDSVISRFREKLDYCKTSWEKIQGMLEVLAGFYRNPVIKGGCPIFNTAMDSSNVHPTLKSRARDGLKMLVRYLEIKMEEGIASGEFEKPENISSLASISVITVEGGIVMSRAFDDEKYVKNALDQTVNMLSHALKIKN